MTTPDDLPQGDPVRQRKRRAGRGIRAAFVAFAAAGLLGSSGCGAPAEPVDPAPPIPSPPTETGVLTEEDVNAWLDGLVPGSLEQTGITGATVSVVHEGELVTARGYGYSDIGSGEAEPRPVDPEDSLFRIASISKVFTATAVMQLVEAGELDLDTDVDEYLDFEAPRTFSDDITLRHLLSHTPGYEERVEGQMLAEGEEPDLREDLVSDPPEQVFQPGTVPAYSNYGYTLAGYIVELTSGMRFNDYVQENILDRIGMDSTTLEQPLPEELESRLVSGYPIVGEPAGDFEMVSGFPAGAVTSSATDMGLFMQAQLGNLPPGQALLEPETLALMREPALGEDSLGNLAAGPQMTLGLFEEDRNGHRIVGHGGDTNLFHSHMQVYPEDNSGIFVSVNSGGNTGAESAAFRTALSHGFADRYFPAGPGILDSDVEPTAREHAAMAEGSYEHSRWMFSNFLSAFGILYQSQVTAQADGTILFDPYPETGTAIQFEEIEPWVWREVGGQRVVTMRVEDDQVEEIGFGGAFTLLATGPERAAGTALPVVIASLSILLIAILSWPIGAILRRSKSAPRRDSAGRIPRVLTRISVASMVLAVGGWYLAAVPIMEGADTPLILLRVVQAIQFLGALGVFPAGVVLFNDFRHGSSWWRRAGSTLILAALLGACWFAGLFGLLSSSVSY